MCISGSGHESNDRLFIWLLFTLMLLTGNVHFDREGAADALRNVKRQKIEQTRMIEETSEDYLVDLALAWAED